MNVSAENDASIFHIGLKRVRTGSRVPGPEGFEPKRVQVLEWRSPSCWKNGAEKEILTPTYDTYKRSRGAGGTSLKFPVGLSIKHLILSRLCFDQKSEIQSSGKSSISRT
jgi:hypothetical protein